MCGELGSLIILGILMFFMAVAGQLVDCCYVTDLTELDCTKIVFSSFRCIRKINDE